MSEYIQITFGQNILNSFLGAEEGRTIAPIKRKMENGGKTRRRQIANELWKKIEEHGYVCGLQRDQLQALIYFYPDVTWVRGDCGIIAFIEDTREKAFNYYLKRKEEKGSPTSPYKIKAVAREFGLDGKIKERWGLQKKLGGEAEKLSGSVATLSKYTKDVKRGRGRISKDKIEKIREPRKKGISRRDIAIGVGVSTSTVTKYGRDIKVHRGRRKTSTEKIEKIQELWKNRISKKDIAKKLDVSTPTVPKYCKNIERGEVNKIKLEEIKTGNGNGYKKEEITVESKRIEDRKEEITDDKSLIQSFRQYMEIKYSPTTVRSYLYNLEYYKRFLQSSSKSIVTADIGDIYRFVDSLIEGKNRKGTIKNYISAIITLYKYLKIYHNIDIPDLDRLIEKEFDISSARIPEATERTAITREEERSLICSTNNLRDTLLTTLLCYTGLRASEIANMKLKDVNKEKRELKVIGKGNKTRKVPYSSDLDRLMNRWINKGRESYVTSKESEYFFVGKRSEKLSRNDIWEIVHQAAEDAGIQKVIAKRANGANTYKVTTHTLRHCFATHAAEDGIQITHISRLMGHSNISTTFGYMNDPEEESFNDYQRKFRGIG